MSQAKPDYTMLFIQVGAAIGACAGAVSGFQDAGVGGAIAYAIGGTIAGMFGGFLLIFIGEVIVDSAVVWVPVLLIGGLLLLIISLWDVGKP